MDILTIKAHKKALEHKIENLISAFAGETKAEVSGLQLKITALEADGAFNEDDLVFYDVKVKIEI